MYEKRNEYSKNDGSLSNLRCQIDYQILKYTRAYERERDSLRERLSKEKKRVWLFFFRSYSDAEIADMLTYHNVKINKRWEFNIALQFQNALYDLKDLKNLVKHYQSSIYLSDREVVLVYGK